MEPILGCLPHLPFVNIWNKILELHHMGIRIDHRHENIGDNAAFSAFVIKCLRNRFSLLLIHGFLFVGIYFASFGLRFDFDFVKNPLIWESFTLTILWVVCIKLVVFYANRHFHDIWYYATAKDIKQLIFSAGVAMLLIIALKAFFITNVTFPRSIPILDAILTVFVIGGLRLSLRIFRDDIRPLLTTRDLKSALLVGANHEGGKLANNIQSSPDLGYKIVGFITIHPEKIRLLLGSIPVLGHLNEIQNVAKKHRVTEILVIAGILNGQKMRELSDLCKKNNLNLRIVPRMGTRLGSKTIPIRDINIDDLLKRDPIQLDNSKICELVKGHRVLVTGGGGSIGSEICRQLVRFHPENLMILGRGENRIFFLERELSDMDIASNITPIIADVTNANRMNQVFDEYRPEVIFHAAAHKHVPLMEANISEAIRNNIYGTKIVADLCDEYEAKTFVLVSTDKAVNPTSVMGTTKHMAERYVHAMSQISSTRFVVTRFGNVLGSAGSVVPIFRSQIQNGGPITITDERMTRFFMTIPEASQLVLQAAAMGQGGEIFVLDMGEPVKIVDLAKDMIRLAGLPENSIEIQFTGLRPGEKLYEELYFDSEQTLETEHPKLRAAQHREFQIEQVRYQIKTLCRLLDEAPQQAMRDVLREYVPEYKPFQEKEATCEVAPSCKDIKTS